MHLFGVEWEEEPHLTPACKKCTEWRKTSEGENQLAHLVLENSG